MALCMKSCVTLLELMNNPIWKQIELFINSINGQGDILSRQEEGTEWVLFILYWDLYWDWQKWILTALWTGETDEKGGVVKKSDSKGERETWRESGID